MRKLLFPTLFVFILIGAIGCKRNDNNLKEIAGKDILHLADSLKHEHEFSAANKILIQALSINDSALKVETRIEILNRLAYNYRRLGEFDSSLYFSNKAVRTAAENKLDNSLKVAQTYYLLGLLYRDSNADSSKKYFGKSLKIRRELLGENHPLIGDIYNNIGVIYFIADKYDTALQYYEKAAHLRKLRGENNPGLASTFMNMANSLSLIGDYSNALAYYDSALTIENKIDSVNNPLKGHILVNIAALYNDLGDTRKSIKVYKQALRIYKNVYGDEHPYVAVVYNNIATASFNLGDYETAVEYLLESVRIKEKKKEVLGNELLDNYLNLSEAYYNLEDYDKALTWGNRGLELAKNFPSAQKQTVVLTFIRLAHVHFARGDTLLGLNSAENALKISQKVYPENSILAAQNYMKIAAIYKDARQFNKALKYVNRAEKYFEEMETRNYYWLAFSQLLKSEILLLMKNYAASLREIARIESYFRLPDGKLDEDKIIKNGFQKSYVNLNYIKARNYFALSKKKEKALMEKSLSALEVAEDFFTKTRKEIRNDKSKVKFSKKMREVLSFGINVAFELYREENDIRYFERALNFAEDGKSLLLLENISEKELLKILNVPDSLLEKRMRLRADIANNERILSELEISGESEKIEEMRNEIFRLKRELENTNSELEKNHKTYSQFLFGKRKLSVEKIRERAIEKGQSIIEFFITPQYLFTFVISKNDYHFLRTPLRFNVSEYVNELLAAIKENNKNDFAQYSFSLYKLLFLPIENTIGTERLLIVNDGVLGYIPYDALLFEPVDGNLSYKEFPYLIKKYSIGYAFSISVLLESNGNNTVESFLGVAPLSE